MSKSPTVVVALAGIALGVVIGWLVRPASRERIDPVQHATERLDRSPDAAASSADPGPAATKERAPEAVRTEDPAKATSVAFDVELARRGRDGIRSGWSDLRRDEIPETLLDSAVASFAGEVARRPEEIGRALATNQTKKEQAAELGPAFLALERLHQGEALPPGLVADPEQFNALFERRAAEIPVDGVKALDDLKSNLTDGATLQFPAGVFRVDLATSLRTLDFKTRALPSDLTVAGAGIDATLLVSGDINLVSAIRNWTFRDCTIFSEGPLVETRNDSSLTLDRVRLTGFDTGAGGSCALFLMSNVLRCRDSIIEGGYGSSPMYGNLMDVRSDAMLARFERCRLACLHIGWARDSWRIAFDDCQFTDYLTHGDPRQPKLAKGMTTTNCTFTLFDDSKGAPPRKSLDSLFPNWEKIQRR
jgi:hypothetical protein